MKKILFFLFLIPFLCEGQTSGVGSVSELQALRTASAKQTGTTLPVLKLVPVTVSGKYEFKSGQFQTPDALKMGFMRKLSDGSYGIAVDGSLIGSGGSGSVTLSNSRTATTFDIIPASGTATTIPAATTSLAGALPAADKVFLDNVPTSLGIAKNATGFGTFTGSTIPDNQSAKGVDQALETAVEARQLGILYEDEFSALGTLGTAVKVAYRGTGLSATRSGDTIIVTSSASSPVQYEDDAAAATGGVAIGSTYYVSASNPYGLPVGAQRVRVAFLLLLGIPMKRRNMNMKKILLSVLMMLFAFVGFSQTNVIGGGGVSKFATTATLKTSNLPSKTGLDISRQAMVLADSGMYDLRGANWHRTNPIKAATAPLVYDGVINNADAEWINTTTQLKHKVNTATGKWRVQPDQKITLANFPVASSTVETEGVRLISSSDTSAWISKTRTGGVLVWERETAIDSTVTPNGNIYQIGSNNFYQGRAIWKKIVNPYAGIEVNFTWQGSEWQPEKGYISSLDVGCKLNDFSFDSRPFIQFGLDSMTYDFKVVAGNYYFKSKNTVATSELSNNGLVLWINERANNRNLIFEEGSRFVSYSPAVISTGENFFWVSPRENQTMDNVKISGNLYIKDSLGQNTIGSNPHLYGFRMYDTNTKQIKKVHIEKITTDSIAGGAVYFGENVTVNNSIHNDGLGGVHMGTNAGSRKIFRYNIENAYMTNSIKVADAMSLPSGFDFTGFPASTISQVNVGKLTCIRCGVNKSASNNIITGQYWRIDSNRVSQAFRTDEIKSLNINTIEIDSTQSAALTFNANDGDGEVTINNLNAKRISAGGAGIAFNLPKVTVNNLILETTSSIASAGLVTSATVKNFSLNNAFIRHLGVNVSAIWLIGGANLKLSNIRIDTCAFAYGVLISSPDSVVFDNLTYRMNNKTPIGLAVMYKNVTVNNSDWSNFPNNYIGIIQTAGSPVLGASTVFGSGNRNIQVEALDFKWQTPLQRSIGNNTIGYGSNSPTYGNWTAGDMMINTSVTQDTMSWLCTVSGFPGTWIGTGFKSNKPTLSSTATIPNGTTATLAGGTAYTSNFTLTGLVATNSIQLSPQGALPSGVTIFAEFVSANTYRIGITTNQTTSTFPADLLVNVRAN